MSDQRFFVPTLSAGKQGQSINCKLSSLVSIKLLKRDIQKLLYQSEEPCGGVITCLLAAMVGSAAFSIILSNGLPAINFLWSLDSQSVLIAAIAIVSIQVLMLENSRSPLLSAVHGILITSTAIASYAVALKGYWIHPVYDSFSVGGLIPSSDALAPERVAFAGT